MKVSRMLLHRIVVRSDADQLSANIQYKGVKFMIADGTGFPEWKKKQKPDDARRDTQSLPKPQSLSEIETRNKQVIDRKIKDRKSDVKVVIGLNDKSELVPMGVWAKLSWKTVAKAITKANLDQRIKQRPLVDLLICDGEPSLIEHMNPLAKSVQRCQWHLTYDFFHLMRYKERCDVEISRKFAEKLYQTMQVELPSGLASQAESDRAEQSLSLQSKIFQAERALSEVSAELRSQNFLSAATYVENAKSNLFNFIRHWIRTGEVAPKVSSKIERLMRELGRRIKKIGFNWSAEGAARMTRILLKTLAGNQLWEREWQEKLGPKERVNLIIKGVYCST
jgi:hypothetical protein